MALALAGCEAPVAEVVVVVRADAALAGMLRNVRVEARRRGAATAVVQQTFPIARHPLPGYVAIVAADPDDARPLEVSVTADVGDPGRGDFTHRVVTRFQKNAVLYVDVLLADRCRTESVRAKCTSLGLTCGETGNCIPVDRPGIPTPPAADAGASVDAGYVCRPAATGPAVTSIPTCRVRLDDAMERCGDGLDNDCDGVADEGCCARSCEGETGDAATHCNEVIVAGGEMTLGEEGGAPSATPPVQNITVSAFRMDSYEVTVARFRRFVAAGMPAPPAQVVRLQRAITLQPVGGGPWPVSLPYVAGMPLADGGTADLRCNWTPSPSTWESDPINCVDWYTAMAFCVWDGGRLPTGAEWEFAARFRPLRDDTGNDIRRGRRYPWGDRAPTCDDANSMGCNKGQPRATRAVGVGMNAQGFQLSWLGLYDLAGNVEEFTVDSVSGYDSECWSRAAAGFSREDPVCIPTDMAFHHPVIRGGSLRSREVDLRSAGRRETTRTERARDNGFRCVRLR
jgi:formylglycine-generating enzyme required for sulfatase activity